MALLSTDRVDWKLDEATHDLVVPIQWTTGVDAVAQRLRIKLRWFRDEWFADRDLGVRYLEGDSVKADEAILGNRFDEARARAEYLEQITTTPNVIAVPMFEVSFDGRTRRLSVRCRVQVSFADIGETSVEVNVEQVI